MTQNSPTSIVMKPCGHTLSHSIEHLQSAQSPPRAYMHMNAAAVVAMTEGKVPLFLNHFAGENSCMHVRTGMFTLSYTALSETYACFNDFSFLSFKISQSSTISSVWKILNKTMRSFEPKCCQV